MESILVTGASGFIGSFIAEEALRRGMEVWAGMRATSSRRYLKEPGIRFIELDFARPERMAEALARHKEQHGSFTYIVHCAGVTKCVNPADFDNINHVQTCHFVDLLRQLDMVPTQFLYLSTLSVYGPVHEKDYQPITEQDTPRPNTAYGVSKWKAEQYISGLADFPYVFFRPTGVYGPRETDYYLMMQSIARHVDVAAGFSRQDLTFVYVKDVVQAIFLAIEKRVVRRAYFLSDGRVYSSTDFSDLIKKELGLRMVVRLRLPLWLLKAVSALGSGWSHVTKKAGTLNRDKYKIMKQRNWQCDISATVRELGFEPQYDLSRGVAETVAWYKKEGWL